ncbi:MAG: DUF389 domain-containing protein [Cyanobacteria bacterium J06614_10]
MTANFKETLPDTIQHIAERSEADGSYLVLMAVSGVLAAVAMLTDSVPVLIGSMIIAPALPPLTLISYAIVARQPRMMLKGTVAALLGFGVAIAAALLTTVLLNATNVIPEETNLLSKTLLTERVQPGWYSVITAVAAGIAGTIALNERKTDTLVGVVAALALVPAGAAAAIAFLSQDPTEGWGGLLLLAINVVLIVVAGVATLLFIRLAERVQTTSQIKSQTTLQKKENFYE